MHLVTKQECGGGMTQNVAGGWFGHLMRGIVNLAAGEWGGSRRAARRQMEVLETLNIGPKKQLMLVRCQGERYLVGTGTESVQTIVRVYPNAVATKDAARRGEWI